MAERPPSGRRQAHRSRGGILVVAQISLSAPNGGPDADAVNLQENFGNAYLRKRDVAWRPAPRRPTSSCRLGGRSGRFACAPFAGSAPALGGDQMVDLRRGREEPANMLFEHPVGFGHPFIGMHEFKPPFDEECFDISPCAGGVFGDAPRKGAVALALIAQFVESGEEGCAILVVNLIGD